MRTKIQHLTVKGISIREDEQGGETFWMWKIISDHWLATRYSKFGGEKKKRREWEKTAVSLKFCNNARGCSVRHNSLPSTQCNSNWRNACAARYPMWSDSTWTEFKKKEKKGKAVQHYHRAVRQNTAMHLNIYRNWFRAGRTTTLDEVLLLRFQCRHAAVIL